MENRPPPAKWVFVQISKAVLWWVRRQHLKRPSVHFCLTPLGHLGRSGQRFGAVHKCSFYRCTLVFGLITFPEICRWKPGDQTCKSSSSLQLCGYRCGSIVLMGRSPVPLLWAATVSLHRRAASEMVTALLLFNVRGPSHWKCQQDTISGSPCSQPVHVWHSGCWL